MPRTKTILIEETVPYEPAFREVAIQFATTAHTDPAKRSQDATFYVSLAERDENGTLITAREEDVERIKFDKNLAYHMCGIVPYFIIPTRAQLSAMGVNEEEKLRIADVIGGKLFAQLDENALLALAPEIEPQNEVSNDE